VINSKGSPAGWVLALDFGGTNLGAACFSSAAGGALNRLAQRRISSPKGADAEGQLQEMYSLASELLERFSYEAGTPPSINSVGASFGGPVDLVSGSVRQGLHTGGWDGFPLKDRLEAHFGLPAVVENDGNASALGESCYGAAQGAGDLLYITVSTGVGGGWVLGGKIWRGSQGLAGEIGHTVVMPDGPLCTCGKRGCLERLAAGPFLAQDAREHLSQHPEDAALLVEMVGGDMELITAEHISAAAMQGDPFARTLLERSARAVGLAAGNAASLLNPQLIIVGGGVTRAGDIWWDALRQAAQGAVFPGLAVEILPAGLGEESPLWGAAMLAQELIFPRK
jgi:glucokinase